MEVLQYFSEISFESVTVLSLPVQTGTRLTYTTQKKLRILNILNFLCSAYMHCGTHSMYALHKKYIYLIS